MKEEKKEKGSSTRRRKRRTKGERGRLAKRERKTAGK